MRIERVTVDRDSVEAVVRLDPEEPMRTSTVSGLLERVRGCVPGLLEHRCRNKRTSDMAEELLDTELPHLLEHVALELMALAGSPRSLVGTTVWDFARDGRGVFRVTIAFDDDLVALGALKAGIPVVAHLLGTAPPPDITAEVERLRAVRASGPP